MKCFEYAAILTYKCDVCGAVIKVWNSRDVCGPVAVTCRSCCGQSSVDITKTIHRSSIEQLRSITEFDLYVLVNCTEKIALELVEFYCAELAVVSKNIVDVDQLKKNKFDEIYCNGKAPLLITLQEYESGDYC